MTNKYIHILYNLSYDSHFALQIPELKNQRKFYQQN